jgi:hypothetical protein
MSLFDYLMVVRNYSFADRKEWMTSVMKKGKIIIGSPQNLFVISFPKDIQEFHHLFVTCENDTA